MRVLPAAVVISMALHTAAIAWVRASRPDDPPKPVAVPPVSAAAPVPPADPAPISVVLLPDDSVKPPPSPAAIARAPAPPAPEAPRARPRVVAISTGRPARPEPAPPATRPPPPPAASEPARPSDHPHAWSLLKMRGLPDPDRFKPSELSDAQIDALVKPGKPLPRSVVEDERHAQDIATAREHLGNPKWIANASADEVGRAREELAASEGARAGEELHPRGGGRYSIDHETFSGDVAPDGTVHFKDSANVGIDGFKGDGGTAGVGGHFDATDALMRAHGMDPYAAAKLRALDATRAERVELGKRYRKAQLARSPAWMRRNLVRLWASTRDPDERKQLLFELWDECAETGDTDLVAGGAAARAYLLGFIRTHLPAGSPGAFTPADLARLNRHRQSKATFAPYAD